MDKREYLRVVQVGNLWDTLQCLKEEIGDKITYRMVDAKIRAREATPHKEVANKKPKFFFGPHFFAKLSYIPSVSILVRESRSHIRKTCYGFRDNQTGERVYLRIDPGYVSEFRDSPCGYLIGTRYLIPGLDSMRPPTWEKIYRKVTKVLRSRGIIVKKVHGDKFVRSTRARCKLAQRLIDLRIERRYWKEDHIRRKRLKRAEAQQQVP